MYDNFNFVSCEDLGPQNTDITDAIETTLAAGIPVFVPVGTWLISDLIVPANGIIFGVGNKSILKLTNASNSPCITPGHSTVLDNFCIDGNKANQVGSVYHGINVTTAGANKIILNDLIIKNVAGCGISLSNGAIQTRIINCEITGYTVHGIHITHAIYTSIINAHINTSDPVATGDGIALNFNSANSTGITIDNPMIRSVNNKGISAVGTGGRYVRQLTIHNPQITNSKSHGIYFNGVEYSTIRGGVVSSNQGDGIRIEGDVDHCHVNGVVIKSNLGTGLREVISGITPNYNGLIYNLVNSNGSDAVIKMGVNSFIV
jgi:hypothetical protein